MDWLAGDFWRRKKKEEGSNCEYLVPCEYFCRGVVLSVLFVIRNEFLYACCAVEVGELNPFFILVPYHGTEWKGFGWLSWFTTKEQGFYNPLTHSITWLTTTYYISHTMQHSSFTTFIHLGRSMVVQLSRPSSFPKLAFARIIISIRQPTSGSNGSIFMYIFM